jgi:hypothetical protein
MAVIAAYTSGAAVPIIGVGLGPAMAIVAGIAGAAQIAAIASKKFEPEGGGDAGTADVSGGGAAAAQNNIPTPSTGSGPVTPQFQASSFFGLGQSNLLGGGLGDQKVYVVESDITNTQNRVRTIENRSVLGG